MGVGICWVEAWKFSLEIPLQIWIIFCPVQEPKLGSTYPNPTPYFLNFNFLSAKKYKNVYLIIYYKQSNKKL
jgi:hypothetical protein